MKDEDKTRKQRINELEEMRRSVTELDALVASYKQELGELKLVEQRYQSIFELAPDGIIVIDRKGIVTSCNKAYFKLSGFSKEEIIGRHFSKLPLLKARDIPKYVKLFASIVSEKEIEPFEFTWIHKDGTSRTGEFRAAALKAGTRIIGVQAVVREITERKRAEDSLRLQAEIIANMSEGVYIIRASDGVIVYTNPKFEEIFGYGPGEMVGKHVSIVNAPTEKSPEETASEIIEVIRRTGEWHGEVNNIKKDGTPFWCSASVSTFTHPEYGKVWIAIHTDITERKQTEEKLRGSEEQTKAIFENVNDVIVSLDKYGKLMAANERIEDILGYKREELIGKHFTKLGIFSPKDLPKIAKVFSNIIRGKALRLIEVEPRRKDGGTVCIEASPRLVKKDGKIKGVIGVLRDVTERKRMEEALKKSEEEIRTITDNVPALVSYVDSEGYYRFVNKRYEEWFGVPKEEIFGKHYRQVLGEDASDKISDYINKALSGETVCFEELLPYMCGGTRWVSAQYIPDLGTGGEINGFFALVSDITERKKMEESLRESEKKFSKAFHSNPAAMMISSFPEGRIIDVNDAYARVMGCSREELIGYTVIDKKIWTKPEGRSEVMKTLKERGIIEDMAFGLRTKSGEIRDMLTSVCLIELEGEPYIISASVDITERRQLEEERQRIERLESVGTLAGGIAHDFNNLLTGIMGNIGLARRSVEAGDRDKAATRLAEAEKASLRARDLTTQLLTFSRGGAPVKQVVSLAHLITDSATFALMGSNIRCDYSFPDNLWLAEIDESQVSQVINNLVRNAAEAMPEGGVLNVKARNVAIKATSRLPLVKGRYVELTVEDRGIGISKEHLDRIFEPYFTTKQKGSGLGLTTAYSIIKNHDGYIYAESELGIGTTFHVYLPASKKSFPVKNEGTVGTHIIGNGRILVMDDEDIIRQFLHQELTEVGYEVEVSSDGAQAVEKYGQAMESGQPFDAVILDLTVPGGMGGNQAIKKLLEINPNARVLVSSGYSTDPIMARFKKYGFKGVVAKPYKITELEEKLRNILADTGE